MKYHGTWGVKSAQEVAFIWETYLPSVTFAFVRARIKAMEMIRLISLLIYYMFVLLFNAVVLWKYYHALSTQLSVHIVEPKTKDFQELIKHKYFIMNTCQMGFQITLKLISP